MTPAYRPHGLLAPVVTPFGSDGAVDIEALERLGGELLDAGAAGSAPSRRTPGAPGGRAPGAGGGAPGAPATTGEPTSLHEAERDAVVAACARVCADRGA